MPTLTRTREEALTIAGAGLGTHWPNPWWPGGSPSHNDCAAFVSWALYGLNGRTPFITWVPDFMKLAVEQGRWTEGATGLQRGDLPIFDWHGRGSRDHIGIALEGARGNRVLVRQTNNAGSRGGARDAAADLSYSTALVLGHYRPPYAASGSSGTTILVDGVFGRQTVRRLQQALRVTVDGVFGPQTKRALQARLGVPVDGLVGPVTVRALQRAVGATVDGEWGQQTARRLQEALNDDRF